MALAEAPRVAVSPEQARAALAAEWEARGPCTPSEVLDFYTHTEGLEADLEAFHADPERQAWTRAIVHVAGEIQAKVAIDIGCGAGHDLRALRAAGVAEVQGVEPNVQLRAHLNRELFSCSEDVAHVPIEQADLLVCIDVLEHIPDPEAFLGSIAQRARIGATLVETCATFDVGTPLHLPANRGWRTGRVLERYGWEKIAEESRMRVWQRMATQNRVSTSLILCTARSVSLPTHRSILNLMRSDPENARGWRPTDAAESGLLRARNIAAARWWADTADDVFLMVDDDIAFEPEHAERLVDRCRNGHDIVAAAYPVRDGAHLAVRALDGSSTDISFGPGMPPREMRHMSTGFFAVHRRVLDALIPTVPLCHANQTWAFWPVFDFRIVEDEGAGGWNWLSEDYYFCERARQAGFKVWLDPTIKLRHMGMVPISVQNMAAMSEVIKHA